MNKLKADKNLWPSKLRESNDFYNTDFDYYHDITYICRKCGAEAVHSAKEQKFELEVLKKNISKVLCEPCFSVFNELKSKLKKYEQQWELETNRQSASYLLDWYKDLVEYSKYTKRYDQGRMRYLEKRLEH